MKEKASRMGLRGPTLAEHQTANMHTQRLPPSGKFLMALLSAALIFHIVLSLLPKNAPAQLPSTTHNLQHDAVLQTPNHFLVPLEAHIMSKCPDARDCLRDLVVPAMEQVVDKVNFTLSFIGSECLGDMLSLCAVNLFPTDPVRFLGFTNCMISSYTKIPSRELVEPCALEHGIAFEDLNGCVSEEGRGLDLLMNSVERSNAAGVKRSCTVRLDDRIWCVRDGGEWKDCPGGSNTEDLVEEVERLYED
ncbi:MAG: hypothetical protein Q9223_003466 [Gallowayella weberi]